MILEWIFELKLDGYRSPAVIEHGRAQLLSRNRHPFVSFAEVGTCITGAIPNIGRVASRGYTSVRRARRNAVVPIHVLHSAFHAANLALIIGLTVALPTRVITVKTALIAC